MSSGAWFGFRALGSEVERRESAFLRTWVGAQKTTKNTSISHSGSKFHCKGGYQKSWFVGSLCFYSILYNTSLYHTYYTMLGSLYLCGLWGPSLASLILGAEDLELGWPKPQWAGPRGTEEWWQGLLYFGSVFTGDIDRALLMGYRYRCRYRCRCRCRYGCRHRCRYR